MTSAGETKQKAIIVDLDGTLSDCSHRLHFLKQEKKDWDSFHKGCRDDPLVPWCKTIISALKPSHAVLIVSGRSAKYRQETIDWLAKHEIEYDDLFLRADKDYRQDSAAKGDIYRKHTEPYFEVEFCIEDRKQAVDLWRSLGLICLQCADGYF